MTAPLPTVYVNGQGAVSADGLNTFIQTVSTAAQLRTFSGISGMVVLLQGLASPADGGGANYYWSVTSTGPDNGSTVIKPLAISLPSPGAWIALPSGAYPVIISSNGGDDTAVLQAALTVGGVWYLQALTYNYTSLTAPAPVRLVGGLQAGGSPATILNCTAATATDKIIIGSGVAQLDGVEFEHILFTAPNSGGGAILFFNFCADSAVRDFQMYNLGATAIGIKLTRVNTVRIYDGRIINPTRAGIYAYGTDTARSDVISIINLIVSGDSTGAATHLPAGIERDGFVNTINGTGWFFVNCGRGLWLHNSVGATLRAEFIMVHDMEVDYPYYEATRLDYGDSCYFVNCYHHGSITAANIYIGSNSPNTVDNIHYIGGQSTSAFKQGIYVNSLYTTIQGMEISFNGQQASNTWPGVEIGPNSNGVSVIGNHIGARSGSSAGSQNYGVLVDAGAFNYIISNNDLYGNLTGPLRATSIVNNSSGIITPNIGMTVTTAFAVQAPVTGFSISLGSAGGFLDVSRLTLRSAGALANGTITMNPAAFNGQLLSLFSTQTVTALTIAPGAGQVIDASVPSTIAAGTGFTLAYDSTTSTWFRNA